MIKLLVLHACDLILFTAAAFISPVAIFHIWVYVSTGGFAHVCGCVCVPGATGRDDYGAFVSRCAQHSQSLTPTATENTD